MDTTIFEKNAYLLDFNVDSHITNIVRNNDDFKEPGGVAMRPRGINQPTFNDFASSLHKLLIQSKPLKCKPRAEPPTSVAGDDQKDQALTNRFHRLNVGNDSSGPDSISFEDYWKQRALLDSGNKVEAWIREDKVSSIIDGSLQIFPPSKQSLPFMDVTSQPVRNNKAPEPVKPKDEDSKSKMADSKSKDDDSEDEDSKFVKTIDGVRVSGCPTALPLRMSTFRYRYDDRMYIIIRKKMPPRIDPSYASPILVIRDFYVFSPCVFLAGDPGPNRYCRLKSQITYCRISGVIAWMNSLNDPNGKKFVFLEANDIEEEMTDKEGRARTLNQRSFCRDKHENNKHLHLADMIAIDVFCRWNNIDKFTRLEELLGRKPASSSHVPKSVTMNMVSQIVERITETNDPRLLLNLDAVPLWNLVRQYLMAHLDIKGTCEITTRLACMFRSELLEKRSRMMSPEQIAQLSAEPLRYITLSPEEQLKRNLAALKAYRERTEKEDEDRIKRMETIALHREKRKLKQEMKDKTEKK